MAPRPRCAPDTRRQKPDVVVFGVYPNGSVRGGCFPGKKITMAAQAAVLLGLEVYEAIFPEMQELVEELPPGRVFANGHALLPAISVGLYKQLYIAFGGLVREGRRRTVRRN